MSQVIPLKSALPSHENDVDQFVKTVGMRVRQQREAAKISRRELSEKSSVSQRYLAQIESGEGNISIALLKKVAIALATPVETLLRDETALGTEGAAKAELYELLHSATPKAREKALDILRGATLKTAKANRVCLIGLRGAGKSTIGPLLANELGVPFLELNSVIEEQAGMPVDEVIALYGQEGYRSLERQALETIIEKHDNVVLAAAGGIVSETDTYEYMLNHFHSIWLRAKPEEHMARVRAQGDERPMAGNPRAMEQLKSILMSRETEYARAEVQVDTSGDDVSNTLAKTLRALPELDISSANTRKGGAGLA